MDKDVFVTADEPAYTMALDTNRELTFNEAKAVVIRSDDYGVAGFETFVSASEADRFADALRPIGGPPIPAFRIVPDICRRRSGQRS